jgi:hypothetical protein
MLAPLSPNEPPSPWLFMRASTAVSSSSPLPHAAASTRVNVKTSLFSMCPGFSKAHAVLKISDFRVMSGVSVGAVTAL